MDSYRIYDGTDQLGGCGASGYETAAITRKFLAERFLESAKRDEKVYKDKEVNGE